MLVAITIQPSMLRTATALAAVRASEAVEGVGACCFLVEGGEEVPEFEALVLEVDGGSMSISVDILAMWWGGQAVVVVGEV